MMRTFLTILLCLGMSFQIGAQSYLQRADKEFDMLKYQEAIRTYLLALDEHPNDPHIISRIAESHFFLNDDEKAAMWFEKAVKQENVSPDEIFKYGQVLKSLQKYDEAKVCFKKFAMVDEMKGNQMAASCDFAKNCIAQPTLYRVTNPFFNTNKDDFAPVVWKDNLVFTSFRKDIAKTRKANLTPTSKDEKSDIFLVAKNGNREVKFLFDNLVDLSGVGPIAFSSNESKVAVTRNNFKSGQKIFVPTTSRLSIYLADVSKSNDWSDLTPFPFNDNSYSTGFPWLSDDGTIMFFASDMPGGYGGYDIYVSRSQNGEWTHPKNLGPAINTGGNEISPYITGDDFYFSSDGHAGIGGLDIFHTIRHGENWAIVKHMGNGINSSKDDFGFSYDQDQEIGYFSSDRKGGRGGLDVYKIQDPLRDVRIFVLDKTLKTPIDEVNISFSKSGKTLVTNEGGFASILISKDSQDELLIEKEGFYKLSMRLANLSTSKNEMKYEIWLEKKEMVGEINPVVATKSPSTHTTVPEIAETYKSAPKKKIYVKEERVVIPEPVFEQKFAVQVAAFSKGNFDPVKYSRLASFGMVYDHQEQNMTKVRVGYFETSEEAKSMMKEIRKSGYTDAFVVKQMIGNHADAISVRPDIVLPKEEFKVRLATYSKPGQFDAGSVEHLGVLESYRKNEWTIMLLGGYTTLQEAQVALHAAQGKGYTDAHIVQDKGGFLARIE